MTEQVEQAEPIDPADPPAPPATPAPEATARRGFLRGLGLAGGGALAGGLTGFSSGEAIAAQAGPGSAAGRPHAGPWRPVHGHVDVTWAVDTSQKLVALTFDDGPMPDWTPMVHDVLDEEKARATFFMVGERLMKNARLVHGRMARHEAGNHTWRHSDLSQMSYDDAYEQIHRTHAAIHKVTGREARFLRPPYGHLGGTTLSAAGELGYDITMWSLQMLEKTYRDDPPGLVDYIVGNTRPGTIVLAHDVGKNRRLVTLRNLVPMIRGLRAKGFEFVTVSELIQASAARSPAGVAE